MEQEGQEERKKELNKNSSKQQKVLESSFNEEVDPDWSNRIPASKNVESIIDMFLEYQVQKLVEEFQIKYK